LSLNDILTIFEIMRLVLLEREWGPRRPRGSLG